MAPASWSIRRTSVVSFSRTRRSTSASAALAANGARDPSFARSGRKKVASGSRPARGEGDLESCRRPERASCGVRDVDVAAEVDALSGEREDWSEASIEDAEGASGSLRRRTVFAAAAAAFPAVLDPDAPIEPHPAPRESGRAGDLEGDEIALSCFRREKPKSPEIDVETRDENSASPSVPTSGPARARSGAHFRRASGPATSSSSATRVPRR
jgi:hypothetical protein